MNLVSTREAYGIALKKIANREDIIVLDADLSKSTKTIEFKKIKPNHFFNIGIAEQNLMGIAAGIAATGKIPFVSTFAIFATGRGFEIIRNSIAYSKLNVKIIATHSGITVGEDGGSHQSIEDISLMRSIPNMVVIVPCDANETIKVIDKILEYKGPVYVRLGRTKVCNVLSYKDNFKIGKHNIIKKGKDITIIACGIMVKKALLAANRLNLEKIDVEVINASTIKPFDKKTLLKSVEKTRCILTAEEHSLIGGLASIVSEILNQKDKKYLIQVKHIGIKDVFGESGKSNELLKKYGLTENNIYYESKKMFKKKYYYKGEKNESTSYY